MSDIFKALCQDTCNERKFGICDDRPHQRAYIDTNEGAKWIAVINNPERISVTFTAIDNCIELRTAENKMEDRCEGVLTYENTIIFIEAKERKSKKTKDWAKVADEQLRSTILSLSAKVALDAYANKRAAICNRLRTKNIEKHSVRIRKFYDETGYTLSVKNHIKIG